MNKYNIILMICIATIVAIVVDKVEDKFAAINFMEETQKFMGAGGRNTAKNGTDICERTNVLESFHSIEPSDCEAIYSRNY